MSPLSNLAVRDIETLVHPYANLARLRQTGPLVIERGEGIYVYDSEGKPYIEGMAGLWCTALGYGNEELVEVAAAQMRKLSFAHLFNGRSHDPAIELAEKLKEIAPVPISKVFFCNSGSEANDTQVKLVWYLNNARGKPSKKKIISRMKGYHGVTVASASLTGLAGNHRDFDIPLPGFLHTGCPHHYRFAQDGETEEEFASRLADELEALVVKEGPDTVAAFIAEPVMGAGGVIVPPKTYFPKIMAICAKHDVFVISDEVICGFGRLGTMFGCEKFGFKPQSISVAKALSSAYLPIAAVMIPELMYEALLAESKKIGSFGHGFTYGGHPVSAAVAVKVLEIYVRDRIIEKAAKRAPLFQARLAALNGHPLVGEARGVGLIGGVELVADKASKRLFDPQHGVGAQVVRFAEQEGLIVRVVAGDVLTISPPLVIGAAQIEELFNRLTRALDRTLDWVTRERLAQT
ncbi:MAG: aspartate aminotransferase family protein [Hyphomicrobiales bacterium]|nr:aspartate aminotransferase family protein [Hyphomicrobiales bacterium]MDE1972445.1 aspartate aminotransferase family protein [Hyphomicrobiales bacterium]MDE2284680.1 aspartate aminotransferase family protein [Hyphomicrobiales bacterium]